MGCPDLETLAAFVDGTLAVPERRQVVVHLADCERCFEVTSETMHSEGELEEETEPNTTPYSTTEGTALRFQRRVWPWLTVAAAGLILVILPFAVRQPSPALWGLMASSEVPGALPEGWVVEPYDSQRSYRGNPGGILDLRAEMHLGALLADIHRAVQTRDRPAVGERAEALANTLDGFGLAALQREDCRRLKAAAQPGAASWKGIESQAQELEGQMLAVFDPQILSLGYWVEVGRLTGIQDPEALVTASSPWRKRLEGFQEGDFPPPVAEALARVAEAAEAGDGARIVRELEALQRR